MLIGRQAEWTALQNAHGAAREGRPRITVVRGPAGIGKTAMVDELARGAVCNALVLRSTKMGPSAGCAAEELLRTLIDEAPPPPSSALDLFRRVSGSKTLEITSKLLGAIPGASVVTAAFKIALIVGRKDAVPTPVALSAQPVDRISLGARILAATATERPVLVLVDDAQWLDEQSVAMLARLATRTDQACHLHVVLAQRPSSGDPLLTNEPLNAIPMHGSRLVSPRMLHAQASDAAVEIVPAASKVP